MSTSIVSDAASATETALPGRWLAAAVMMVALTMDLGQALAGFFLSGYVGLSLPVTAVGIALQSLSARATLLAFAIVVSAGILAASRILLIAHAAPPASLAPESPGPEHPASVYPAPQGVR